MSDPRKDDRDDENVEGNYGPEDNTDEVTESDAGMTGDNPGVSPVPKDR